MVENEQAKLRPSSSSYNGGLIANRGNAWGLVNLASYLNKYLRLQETNMHIYQNKISFSPNIFELPFS